jgi:Fe-S-cluster-containing dehydrogenase component
MAILQEVDKCVRCNGCVIACKRTWHMKGDNATLPDLPHQTLDANQRVVIKSQRRVDMGPFVRFSCWHCENPPCAGRCPFKAIKKNTDSGAVWIDPNLCQPGSTNSDGVTCVHQCKIDCQRGGVPMIGAGSDLFPPTAPKAWKCTLCTGQDEDNVRYLNAPYLGAGEHGDLPTKAPLTGEVRLSELKTVAGARYSSVPISDLAHQPTCVFTCPAKAMVYDTRENILAYLNDTGQGWVSRFGDGSMFWASKKFVVAPPKADPFMEDHIAPMVGSLLSSPFAKAALAPTLVVGGLLALSARRAKIEEEALSEGGAK